MRVWDFKDSKEIICCESSAEKMVSYDPHRYKIRKALGVKDVFGKELHEFDLFVATINDCYINGRASIKGRIYLIGSSEELKISIKDMNFKFAITGNQYES